MNIAQNSVQPPSVPSVAIMQLQQAGMQAKPSTLAKAVKVAGSCRLKENRPCAAVQATIKDTAGAAVHSTDRRTVLLGTLIGGQILQLPAQVQALADDTAAITKVFVAGATGRTGRRVVQQLRASGYKVRAGVRDRRKAQSLGFALDKGIEVVEADVTKGASVLEAAIGDAEAVICATGATGFGSNSAASVDEKGSISLIDAAQSTRVKAFVLMSSLLTNAVAVGQKDNPNYKFLNLFGGVLDRKLAAEQHLRESGLRYTIVRPGGLSDGPADDVGRLIVAHEDTLFGLDGDPGRVISRDTVAQVLVAALRQSNAANKVVEVVASPSATQLPEEQWFAV